MRNYRPGIQIKMKTFGIFALADWLDECMLSLNRNLLN